MALIDDTTDGLIFQVLDANDSIGTWLDKQNANFRLIAQYGGGRQGPPGPQGIPGCTGKDGPIGPPGENTSSGWTISNSFGCEFEPIHEYEDIIMNKWSAHNMLLTNLVNDDSRIKMRISDNERSFKWSVRELKDSKLQIINSLPNGQGNHIALVNSKAIEENNKFLCKSGFNISLDYLPSNTEILRITSQKNDEIDGHSHHTEISTDTLNINKNKLAQTISFDSNISVESENKGTFKLEELNSNQVYNIPDRSGFLGVWENTLDNSEIWENIQPADILTKRFRYSNTTGYHEIAENEAQLASLTPDSKIRFKRLNNFVLIDFHLGITNQSNTESFTVENIQYNVNKKTVPCITQGWHTSTILTDERYIPTTKPNLTDFGLFSVSPTVEDSYTISLRFLNGRGLTFSSGSTETYYVTGQVWATVQKAQAECLILDIEQEEICIPPNPGTSGTSGTTGTAGTAGTSNTSGTSGTSSTSGTSGQLNCITIPVVESSEFNGVDWKIAIPPSVLNGNPNLINNAYVRDTRFKDADNKNHLLVPYHDYWFALDYLGNIKTDYIYISGKYCNRHSNLQTGNSFEICFNQYVPSSDTNNWNWLEMNITRTIPRVQAIRGAENIPGKVEYRMVYRVDQNSLTNLCDTLQLPENMVIDEFFDWSDMSSGADIRRKEVNKYRGGYTQSNESLNRTRLFDEVKDAVNFDYQVLNVLTTHYINGPNGYYRPMRDCVVLSEKAMLELAVNDEIVIRVTVNTL